MSVPFGFVRLIVVSDVSQTEALKLSHLKQKSSGKICQVAGMIGHLNGCLAISTACDVLSSFAQASFLIFLYYRHAVPFKQQSGKGRRGQQSSWVLCSQTLLLGLLFGKEVVGGNWLL